VDVRLVKLMHAISTSRARVFRLMFRVMHPTTALHRSGVVRSQTPSRFSHPVGASRFG